jgi:hypothetical protein
MHIQEKNITEDLAIKKKIHKIRLKGLVSRPVKYQKKKESI